MYVVQYGQHWQGVAKVFNYHRDAMKFVKQLRAKKVWHKMVRI